jgi:hypothetical protein
MSHKLIASVCTITAASVFLVGAAQADPTPQGGGANNVVLVQATADDSSIVRSNTQVAHFGGPNLHSANVASAVATNCTACHSTAVAVQVVFATGSPQDFQPANVAVAENISCTLCGSFAYAWQYIVQTDGPVRLSAQGEQEVQALKQEIDATAASIEPDSLANDLQLQSQLDTLTGELKDVIDTQMVQVGVHGAGAVHEHVDRSPDD